MHLYTFIFLIVAAVTIIICTVTDRRLALAALGVGGGYALIVFSQLVLGLVAPALTVLTAACDMVTLGCIGWVLMRAKRRGGLHVAGFAMCVSLMSHVAYHIAGIGEGATLAYFLVTNSAMVVACLGLLCTALGQLVGKYGMVSGGHSHNGSGLSGAARVAARYNGQS
jgi:hypothetical protein